MNPLVLIHLVAVAVLAVSNIGALVTTVIARRATSPSRILRLLAIHNVLAAKTLVPAAVVTLVSGAWLTDRTGASLVAPWMLGTLALFVASALVGVLFLLPEEARATAEARRQVAANEPTASATLVSHTAAPTIIAAEWGAQLTMAAMFVLMIAQPG